MVCRECGARMRLDDRDGFSKENCENYWVCDTCVTSCNEIVRRGVSVSQDWHTENKYPSFSEIIGKVVLLDNDDITSSNV